MGRKSKLTEISVWTLLTITCQLVRSAVYTIIWNTLDCPSLVLPITEVNAELDVSVPAHEFRGADDEAVYKLCKLCVLETLEILVLITFLR